VTDGSSLSLAVMAGALVVTAIVQVAVLVVIAKAGRQAVDTVQQMQREMRPLIEKAHRITDDAARVTSLTLKQVERVDQMITTTAARLESTFTVIETAVIQPIQQGTALLAGVRAAMGVVRAWLDRDRHRAPEEDDGLFIG
jgi:predicted PurR-regulated permease PerM